MKHNNNNNNDNLYLVFKFDMPSQFSMPLNGQQWQ